MRLCSFGNGPEREKSAGQGAMGTKRGYGCFALGEDLRYTATERLFAHVLLYRSVALPFYRSVALSLPPAMYLFTNHTPERRGRVYALWLQEDLFGQWTLVRLYEGAERGPVLRSQVVASREEGEKLLGRLVKVRERHGYVAQGEGSPKATVGESL
jgi:hypothetical protein